VNYYNEFDPYAAQWLRNMISAGHIPAGDVDERNIKEVKADEIKGYTQCHFFAGIGGWPLALKLAGWPDDRSVWTGSCPCQPYSAAGIGSAQSDERHLWPYWDRLIGECKPAAIFGEQVDEAIAYGWLDDAFHDLETKAYSCAAAVLPACSVGAPHERQRIFFCAYAQRDELQGRASETENKECSGRPIQQLSGFLQPHPWPTLSDSKFWANAYGVPADVGVAKANKCVGNAIVPQAAAEFIKASF
jgi:DNA (cytosine-5)-methyltransferase 1